MTLILLWLRLFLSQLVSRKSDKCSILSQYKNWSSMLKSEQSSPHLSSVVIVLFLMVATILVKRYGWRSTAFMSHVKFDTKGRDFNKEVEHTLIKMEESPSPWWRHSRNSQDMMTPDIILSRDLVKCWSNHLRKCKMKRDRNCMT